MEHASALEIVYRIREVGLVDRSFIPISMWLWRLAVDAGESNEPMRTKSILKVEEFAANHRRKFLFRLLVKAFGRPRLGKPRPDAGVPVIHYGFLELAGGPFGLQTINDAAQLLAKVRCPPKSLILRPADLRGILKIRLAPRRWTLA
jgi:hypothetical protein